MASLEICAGQVWESRDKRDVNRDGRLRTVRVRYVGVLGEIEVENTTTGRVTTVSLDGLPRSYRLIREAEPDLMAALKRSLEAADGES